MNTIQAWIHDHFPGHENAFIGGVCGLLTAILFFNLGFWRTLILIILVIVGVAIGQRSLQSFASSFLIVVDVSLMFC